MPDRPATHRVPTGRRAPALLLAALLLTACGSSRNTWFSRAYQNTHAYFNGYYHAELRYREAVKSAEGQYIPPAEGFLPLVDGTDGSEGAGAPLQPAFTPLQGVPLPSVGGEYGGGVGTGLSDPMSRRGGGAMMGQPGMNQPGSMGQPGMNQPNMMGQPGMNQLGLNQPGGTPFGGGGVASIPAPSAQRGPQASLFNEAPAWGPGSSRATAPKALLDETIAKCEYMIFRRPKSNWVDDARFLLGRAAFQQRNYGIALQNFDYILATYPKSDLVPDVMLWRAKIDYQFDNSVACRATLQKMLAMPEVRRDTRVSGALLLAQLLTRDGEYNKAIAVLDDNLAELSTAKDRSRVNYLLGQLYDQRGNYTLAYEHYQRAADVDYSALMTFRSQLALVNLQIKYQPDVERGQALRRELAQMARQGRFAEFHDQIEHQLALQSIKERDYPAAERHLQLALRRNDPRRNPLQRTTSYYELGRLYFDRLGRLDAAQAYFDSAARTVQPDFRDARRIRATAASLKDYIRYRRQAAAADSLLRLSALPDGALAAAVNEALEQEDERRELAAAAEQQRREQQATADRNRINDAALRGPADPTGLGLGEFLFDSPALVERGRGEFQRRWGTRPNVDNWRRGRSIPPGAAADAADVPADTAPPPTVAAPPSRAERRAAAIKAVPRTEEARRATEAQLADALYNLAQTFSQQLELPDSALAVHGRILRRFGYDSEWSPRSLYASYRIKSAVKDPGAEADADRLIELHPASPFTRLVRQLRAGSTLLIEGGDFESGYAALFGLYSQGDYATATTLARFLLERYVDHPDAAKLLYIRSMAFGQRGERDSLQAGLELLIKKYPSSALAAPARQTLDALKTGVGPRARLTPAPGATTAEQRPDPTPQAVTLAPDADRTRAFLPSRAPGEAIFALVLVPQTAGPPDPLREAFEKFNARAFGARGLVTSVFTTLDQNLVYVSQFDSYAAGRAYLDRAAADPSLRAYLGRPDEQLMLATASNFRIAFTQRRFRDYLSFYRANIDAWLKQK